MGNMLEARLGHEVRSFTCQGRTRVRVERERNSAGRSTTNDLLEAEAHLQDQTTRLEIARLDAVSACLKLWLAVGDRSMIVGA